jgi:hypothetical protein
MLAGLLQRRLGRGRRVPSSALDRAGFSRLLPAGGTVAPGVQSLFDDLGTVRENDPGLTAPATLQAIQNFLIQLGQLNPEPFADPGVNPATEIIFGNNRGGGRRGGGGFFG